MPLTTGDKLGPYEILSPIGAGGMGEVYKARDTRLDRTVAIKVLPEHIAKREDLRARFEREARTVASLNHPHICTLHDIGPGYMVMEMIDGETLAARLEKGALPLDQALAFAVQIADALDRAHRAGVTHRDVKPQNIMLTRDGVKVLDFGLAKSSTKPTPSEATLTAALTTEGAVMGTPQYMAPEQFEGREADARSDVWAFGAVLYEMVTGQKAFQGKSYSSLVGAILSADPAPMAVKPFTPAWLERLVRRCLAKDPDDRWQSMRDVALELRTPPPEPPAAVLQQEKATRWPWIVAAGSTVALVLVSAGWYRSASRTEPLRPLVRLNVEAAPDTPLARADVITGAGGSMLALSPDGTRLAVTMRSLDGKVRIHTRLLNQGQFTPLAGTEGAYSPLFSPEGDWIGFFTQDKLKKIAADGGAAVTLCGAPFGYGGSWEDDGHIIAALDLAGGLSRVPSGGGMPKLVTNLGPGEATHRWPQVLPGRRAVLLTVAAQVGTTYDDANIDVLSLETGERKTIVRGGRFARYLAGSAGPSDTGHVVYLSQTTLFAVPFHAGRLAPIGSSTPILDDVDSTSAAGGDFAFARNGTFVYLPARQSELGWPISWVDGSGRTQALHSPTGRYFSPRFSPDGRRLVFSMNSGKGADIWVKDLDLDAPSRLSFLAGTNAYPVWTPDGKYIVFRSTNPAAPGLYGVRSDGTGEAKKLTQGNPLAFPHSFSPDGTHLAVAQPGSGGNDIYVAPVTSGGEPDSLGLALGKPEPFLGTSAYENTPAFSPDGRWLAYASNESGTLEVYVRRYPGPGGIVQISNDGARFPVWSNNGRELLFETFDRQVVAVSYTIKGDSFIAEKPRLWTKTRLRNVGFYSNYALAPDGKRLAAMVADEAAEKPATHLTFLLNFLDELRRKAPEGK
ncbi:MAG: protein kinase [Bryobacteraceae bacterium]